MTWKWGALASCHRCSFAGSYVHPFSLPSPVHPSGCSRNINSMKPFQLPWAASLSGSPFAGYGCLLWSYRPAVLVVCLSCKAVNFGEADTRLYFSLPLLYLATGLGPDQLPRKCLLFWRLSKIMDAGVLCKMWNINTLLLSLSSRCCHVIFPVGGTISVPRGGSGLVGDTDVASIEVAQRG